MPEKTYFMQVYGCQMNELDAELVSQSLERKGYTKASSEEADVLLYATCSVRGLCEDKVYSSVGRSRSLEKKTGRHQCTVVLGCMAQRDGQEILNKASNVDIVVGTKQFHLIPEFLEKVFNDEGPILAVEMPKLEDAPFEREIQHIPGRYQAHVSVQRGCDHMCTYCIVPFTRGRELSRPKDVIIEECEKLIATGVKEITLVGQNVNQYGKRLEPQCDFPELVEAVLQIEGLLRLSFVTSIPYGFDMRLVEIMKKYDNCSNYLHLPFQSGSDNILKAMARRYTKKEYLDIMTRAKEIHPEIAFSTDVIVGYPGETDEDYMQTVDVMQKVCYSMAYIFKYSPRPKTKAAETTIDDVPLEVKKWRNNDLLDIQRKIQMRQHERLVGQEIRVLVTGASKKNADKLTGRSDAQKIVIFDGDPELAGTMQKILIERYSDTTLYGSLVSVPV